MRYGYYPHIFITVFSSYLSFEEQVLHLVSLI